MLGYIDNRLRLIFKNQESLAGLNVILMGDFRYVFCILNGAFIN